MREACSVLLTLAVLSAASGDKTEPAPKKVDYTVLKGWREGRVKEPVVTVYRDEASYTKGFADTYAGFRLPKPTPEKVDFSTRQVVGIFWGPMPSTGYAVSLVSVVGDAAETTITVKTATPKGLAGAAITHPGVVLSIPKAAKVKVIVTGDRNPAGRWYKDFSATKSKELEVVVKK